MAHDQSRPDMANKAAGAASTTEAGGKDSASKSREQAQGGPKHGEQASQIAGSQGQRNEQSRHQDQAARTTREQK